MGVFLMSIFGKIGHAIGGAFKAVGHGIVEGVKQIGLAAEGVVSGFILKPVAGVVSLFSQDLASKIKLPNQDQVDHSFMGKVGEFAGTALGFVGGTALLRGVGMGVTAARVGIGAVEGLAGSSEGSLWDKLKGAGIGALTAGAAGHLGDKVANWVQKGEDTVLHPLVAAGAPRAVTEASDHLMDAEIGSLVRTGHFAGWKEMLPAVAVSGVVSDAGERINNGIDKLMDKLPQGDATTSLSRVLHAEENSLVRTGRFADSGVVISQAIPDGVNSNVDRLINRVSDSHNRFGETAGQFLHSEVDSLRVHGQLVDPGIAFRQAAIREFTPEINQAIDHLPSRTRSAASDMLDGFTIDGMNGITRSAEHTLGQTLHQMADRFLPDRIHGPEPVESKSAQIDRRDVRA
jgi:hypothetical protein